MQSLNYSTVTKKKNQESGREVRTFILLFFFSFFLIVLEAGHCAIGNQDNFFCVITFFGFVRRVDDLPNTDSSTEILNCNIYTPVECKIIGPEIKFHDFFPRV